MKFFNACLSVGLTCLTFLMGDINTAIISLGVLITTDYATGIIAAAYNKTLESKISFKGLLKKSGILAALVVVTQLERVAEIESGAIRNLMAYSFCINESTSIVENLGRMNVHVPILSSFIKNLKNKDNNKKE